MIEMAVIEASSKIRARPQKIRWNADEASMTAYLMIIVNGPLPKSSKGVYDVKRNVTILFYFQRCHMITSTATVDWVEVCLLVIAALIGLIAFIAAIIICCLYNQYVSTLIGCQSLNILVSFCQNAKHINVFLPK